jgi:hypothetical protein
MSYFEERNFMGIMNQIRGFFRDEIRNRGWDFILYGDDPYFVPELVTKFYESFTFDHVAIAKDRIFVSLGDFTHEVGFELISHLTGIPLTSGMNQHSFMTIEEYKLLVRTQGENYPSGGIDGNSMYVNVFATCR